MLFTSASQRGGQFLVLRALTTDGCPLTTFEKLASKVYCINKDLLTIKMKTA